VPKRRPTLRKRAGHKPRKPRRAGVRHASRDRGTEVALAGLAHDIRTPLTGILALADLLHTADLPERERRWAAALKDAATYLGRLTSIVVDGAKANAAGLVLQNEAFSPRELALSVAEALAARVEAKGLVAEVAISRKLPARVIGDPVRLRSALENLVDNAVKFTERGRVRLAVSAAAAGRGRHRLTFELTDSGIGMTADEIKRLFRPFAQASEDIARRYGGAGLGLTLVKRIAAAMGGDLTVTSRPGQGTTFRLLVNVAAANRRPGLRSARRRPKLEGLRVLCVEDNPYGRVVLDAILGGLGHRATFVGSGETAIARIKRGGYDAVLMDVALPGIDGIETTRRIRALPSPAGRIPIIGLSGRSDTGEEAAARRAGMDGYLRKPASPTDLHEVLTTIARVNA
jgi:CheY-like chemotaxis protein/anti-sigma regulatory factor (Ser/Thr protein kinase)